MSNNYFGYSKIEKTINEKYNIKLDDLIKKSDYIKNFYKNSDFTIHKIYGKNCFNNIYQNSVSKEIEDITFLSEKCIKRHDDLKKLEYIYGQDQILSVQLLDESLLWQLVSNKLLNLEILWGMEYQKNANRSFTIPEQENFNYLNMMADFYLEETETLSKTIKEHNKIKTFRKSNI